MPDAKMACHGRVECGDGTETRETTSDVEREGIRVKGAGHWRWRREESTNRGGDKKRVLCATNTYK